MPWMNRLKNYVVTVLFNLIIDYQRRIGILHEWKEKEARQEAKEIR